MNIVIIDDEKFAVSRLKKIIETMVDENDVVVFTDPLEGLSYLISKGADVLFLDIEMPKINGLYIAEQIKKIHPKLNICFVTGYDEYAVKAFELKANDYVIKPYAKERIYEILEDFKETSYLPQEAEENHLDTYTDLRIIGVLENEVLSFIDIDDILYLEYIERKTRIVTAINTYQSGKSLSYYEKQLPNQLFFRCHKSYLVNMDKALAVCPRANYTYDISFRNIDTYVPLSRIRVKELKKRLNI